MVSAEVIAKLPALLKPVSDEQDGNAAVSLLLKPRQGDVDLLLVKRVENPLDTWSIEQTAMTPWPTSTRYQKNS